VQKPPRSRYVSKFGVKPLKETEEFQFQFWFGGEPQPIEFLMTYQGAMILMGVLQEMQAKHKIPIPALLRPKKGRPKLSVVKLDE
jgi:hypothetical protein